MTTDLTTKDIDKIHKAIQKKYKKAAKNPSGLFKYPTGRAGLEALHYDSELILSLPDSIAASYCGVGNPFTLGSIDEGETVLDVGCGAGVDSLIAAMMTGPTGRVIGVDMVSGMLDRAIANLSLVNLQNVSFQEAMAETLPFPNEKFDVIISNGALNLVTDKAKSLSDVLRVLKPEGRLMIADQLLVGELPKEKKQLIKSWSQ